MKRTIIMSVIALSVLACNSNSGKEESKEPPKEEKKEAEQDISSNPDYQAGLAVIGKSDCLTCHKVDEKIQGPTYRDVANRYADSARDVIIPKLASKILDGGSGVWGEIPMTPHPGLTQEEAEAAVKYILLLKSKG